MEAKQLAKEINKEFARVGMLDEKQKLGGFQATVVPMIVINRGMGNAPIVLEGSEDFLEQLAQLPDEIGIRDVYDAAIRFSTNPGDLNE